MINYTSKLKHPQKKIINNIFTHEDTQGHTIYMLSAMCQTSLPINKPHNNTKMWESINGKVSVMIESGGVYDINNKWFPLGLPYGIKPRIILNYMNTKAILSQSPIIQLEDSLRSFIDKIGIDTNGRSYRVIKDQLAKLTTSHITIGTRIKNIHTNIIGTIIKRFDTWFPKNKHQRILWPLEIELSKDYFETLMEHSVPLDKRAINLLKNSALELDIYSMLSERLHRIKPNEPHIFTWGDLWKLYGRGYKRCRDFKSRFKKHLINVKSVYKEASFNYDNKGLILYNSSPPILPKKKYFLK